jgi:hypothetical protein
MDTVTALYEVCLEISKELHNTELITAATAMVSYQRDPLADRQTFQDIYNTFEVGKGISDQWLLTHTVYIRIDKTTLKLSKIYKECLSAKLYLYILLAMREAECPVTDRALGFWKVEYIEPSVVVEDIDTEEVKKAMGAQPSIQGLLSYIKDNLVSAQLAAQDEDLPDGVTFTPTGKKIPNSAQGLLDALDGASSTITVLEVVKEFQ